VTARPTATREEYLRALFAPEIAQRRRDRRALAAVLALAVLLVAAVVPAAVVLLALVPRLAARLLPDSDPQTLPSARR
jgi:hypothetical protein